MFTDYYAEQSCTAGRASFITGQHVLRTGLTKVGIPGAPIWAAEGRSDHRRAAQAARIRDRPVRQEPPGRPQRVPADGPRLRRVLRQSLPPQRRGRARAPRLPEGPRVPQKVRPARRAATARHDGTMRRSIASARAASRRSTTPARSPRSGWRRSTTIRGPADRLHRAAAKAGKPFFVWVNFTHMHFRTHPKPESAASPAGG